MWSYYSMPWHYPAGYTGLGYFPYGAPCACDPAWYSGVCPTCQQSLCAGWHEHQPSPFHPQELSAAGQPSVDATVGGTRNVSLSLEYRPEGTAATREVFFEDTAATGTAPWRITTIPDGPHTKRDFASAEPGAKI